MKLEEKKGANEKSVWTDVQLIATADVYVDFIHDSLAPMSILGLVLLLVVLMILVHVIGVLYWCDKFFLSARLCPGFVARQETDLVWFVCGCHFHFFDKVGCRSQSDYCYQHCERRWFGNRVCDPHHPGNQAFLMWKAVDS